MIATANNRDYLLDILTTPRYLLRKKLEEDYKLILSPGSNTANIIVMVADHLSAYNELTTIPVFWSIRDFKPQDEGLNDY